MSTINLCPVPLLQNGTCRICATKNVSGKWIPHDLCRACAQRMDRTFTMIPTHYDEFLHLSWEEDFGFRTLSFNPAPACLWHFDPDAAEAMETRVEFVDRETWEIAYRLLRSIAHGNRNLIIKAMQQVVERFELNLLVQFGDYLAPLWEDVTEACFEVSGAKEAA